MHLITRRLSPSLVMAIVVLFVALAGTAAAAVIIESPDQIKGGVVTGTKLANDSVSSTKIRKSRRQAAGRGQPDAALQRRGQWHSHHGRHGRRLLLLDAQSVVLDVA